MLIKKIITIIIAILMIINTTFATGSDFIISGSADQSIVKKEFENANALKTYAYYKNENGNMKYVPVEGVTSPVENEVQVGMIKIIWDLAKETIPKELLNEVEYIIIEEHRNIDNLMTISSDDPRNEKFNIHLDAILAYHLGRLQNELAAAAVIMFILDSSEVDFGKKRGNNYKFNDLYYKDESFINIFYERFWKGRKQENTDTLYDRYPREFLSKEASFNVYTDMAVSFMTYMRKGYNDSTNAVTNAKQNFFADYEEFRYLAGILRRNMRLGYY